MCYASRDYIVLSGQGFRTVPDILAGEVEEPGGYFVYKLNRGLTVETDVPLKAADFLFGVEKEASCHRNQGSPRRAVSRTSTRTDPYFRA